MAQIPVGEGLPCEPSDVLHIITHPLLNSKSKSNAGLCQEMLASGYLLQLTFRAMEKDYDFVSDVEELVEDIMLTYEVVKGAGPNAPFIVCFPTSLRSRAATLL